jgi:hypothetical protein
LCIAAKPVAAGQQLGQPLRNPLCDLVLVVGAADHASHVVDEGLEAISSMVFSSEDELRRAGRLAATRFMSPPGT